MDKKKVFSLVLAIAGTVMVLLPILFMIVTAIVGSISAHRFVCDYMIPAEVGFLVIGGAAALLWASIRERKMIKPIAWTAGIGIVLLFGCQLLAVVTGLASGRIQAENAPLATGVVTGMLIGYDVAVALMGVWGYKLARLIVKSAKET
jgi:hypothetical protein